MKNTMIALLTAVFVTVVTVIIGAGMARTEMPEEDMPVETVVYAEPIHRTTYTELSVPGGDTSFKSYMDYTAITNTHSPQYRLQQDCYTDAYGIRRKGSYYCVALGTGYADAIGDKFRITLDSGETFLAIAADFKADCDTDSTHRYTPMSYGGKNVVEFVVETSALPTEARRMGDISYCGDMSGDISKIERME